jgi:hypothetical protein
MFHGELLLGKWCAPADILAISGAFVKLGSWHALPDNLAVLIEQIGYS